MKYSFLLKSRHCITKLVARFGRGNRGSYEIDMCNGPLLGKIIRYVVPLILSGVLQLLFHSADLIVVGRYSGPTALAAVGTTGSITHLLTTLFLGMSVGVNVLVAKYYAANRPKDLSRTVHSAIAIAILFGGFLFIFGQLVTKPILSAMGTPNDVIDSASLYMKIIFMGMPAQLIYNFGSAVLNATGDTRRPLYFLTIAGVINVLINLFLVIVVGLGVDGVAIATIISQYLSAALVVRCLVGSTAVYSINIKAIKIHKDKFAEIVKIGLPAGLQGAMFSIANVLIQSSINSFGSVVMAGNTAAGSLEGFVYVAIYAFHQTSITFVSQNIGGKKYSRIPRIALLSVICAVVVAMVLGYGLLLLAEPLLSIYNDDMEVVAIGKTALFYFCHFYIVYAVMETLFGVLRGMGYSIMTMVTALIGICGVRIIWIFTAFEYTNSLDVLYMSFPVSWIITATVAVIEFLWAKKRLLREQEKK